MAASPTPDDPPEWLDRTDGRPVPGVQVRVVGPDEDELGVGEEGELRLEGVPVLRRLRRRRPGRRRPRRRGLVPHLVDDGNVRITGRLKDRIIRNAENISALEVEDAVLRHPGGADVAVIGVPDSRTGERACAVVVSAPGAELDLPAIVDHCWALGL